MGHCGCQTIVEPCIHISQATWFQIFSHSLGVKWDGHEDEYNVLLSDEIISLLTSALSFFFSTKIFTNQLVFCDILAQKRKDL